MQLKEFVCDDTVKITLVEMGWPGSIHDNWVCSNSDVYLSEVFQQPGVSAWWFSILGIYGYGSCFQKGSECHLERIRKVLQACKSVN